MQINYAKREVSCKLVFYGPGMSGKTTNLEIIHQKVPDNSKGEMTSIATEGDRTLFFDFLPLDLGKVRGMTTKFQLYTVPGQVYYSSTRKLVLQGSDGVIFVADSNPDKLDENIESLKDLQDNLAEYGIKIDEVPLVIQWNKRDLPNAMSVEDLDEKINWMNAATTEAVAATGEGVLPTLKLAASLVLDRLNSSEPGGAAPAKKAEPKAPPKEKKELFVAKVNADQISQAYFTQHCQVQYRLYARSNEVEDFKKFSDDEKKRLIDTLINHALLLQDAKKRNIMPSKEDIDAQVGNYVKKFGDKDKLEKFLANRKLNIDNLRNEATKNVIIAKMIRDVLPDIGDRLKISGADVQAFYNERKDSFGGKPLNEVKEEVVKAFKADRKKELLDDFFKELRKEASIEIFEKNL